MWVTALEEMAFKWIPEGGSGESGQAKHRRGGAAAGSREEGVPWSPGCRAVTAERTRGAESYKSSLIWSGGFQPDLSYMRTLVSSRTQGARGMFWALLRFGCGVGPTRVHMEETWSSA